MTPEVRLVIRGSEAERALDLTWVETAARLYTPEYLERRAEEYLRMSEHAAGLASQWRAIRASYGPGGEFADVATPSMKSSASRRISRLEATAIDHGHQADLYRQALEG